VPTSTAGEVRELLVQAGDTIQVGQTILRVAPVGATAGDPTSTEGRQDVKPEVSPPVPEAAIATAAPAPRPTTEDTPVITFPTDTQSERLPLEEAVPAAPSTRALARQLGVAIGEVRGSGPGGRISRDDVKTYAKGLIQGLPGTMSASPGASNQQPELPDFTQWGEIQREPLGGVRRATARVMATAWATVPHVTQFDHADITQLESMRRKFNARPDAEGRKLSMTAIVIKMAASVLRQLPRFNASLDLAGEAVIQKRYVHIGVAVDTERGLLVPVIRDVDKKNLVQVTAELAALAERARTKKLKPDEMRGASFTVSNLGGLGTTYFSPIVNWPEVAILGVGRAEHQAVFVEGQFQPRLILPLSLSYDHRLIDGADAARFQRRLAEALEQPLLLLLDE
jgi:pyruvate dehydrogenase E2 component (dihydrolipoamide acetyltransferase)